MNYLLSIVFFSFFFCSGLKAQEFLKLSAEVLSSFDELTNSMEDLKKMKSAIKDIEDKKTPNISDNEWSDLASKYREAAGEIDKAPLPTDFDKGKYAVSMDELKNCSVKDATLRKMNDFLQELKNAQERGRQSIITINAVMRKIKVSRELLHYCIDVHEKLGRLPIFGEKFLWDWVELDRDVTDALNVFETAVKKQREKIVTEKSKLDLYVPNFEANLFSITRYYVENCKQKDEIDNQLQKELEKQNGTTDNSPAPQQNISVNGSFCFLTTTIFGPGDKSSLGNLKTMKNLIIVSGPQSLDESNPNELSMAKKKEFIEAFISKYNQKDEQTRKQSEEMRKQLYDNDFSNVEVHYSKMYSALPLKSLGECGEAIDDYKKVVSGWYSNSNAFEFIQL